MKSSIVGKMSYVALIVASLIIPSTLLAAAGGVTPVKVVAEKTSTTGKTEIVQLADGAQLHLRKGECVIIYAKDRKGHKKLFPLNLIKGKFRTNFSKKTPQLYTLCGTQPSYTDIPTILSYQIRVSGPHGTAKKMVKGSFKVIVDAEPVDIDHARAGEAMVSLFWGILFRKPGDPNKQGNEAYNYARRVEKEDMTGLIWVAEELARSEEFKTNILAKYSPEQILDNFYWRFLGINKPTHDQNYNRQLQLIKKRKTYRVVADLLSRPDFVDRVKRNDFYRGK